MRHATIEELAAWLERAELEPLGQRRWPYLEPTDAMIDAALALVGERAPDIGEQLAHDALQRALVEQLDRSDADGLPYAVPTRQGNHYARLEQADRDDIVCEIGRRRLLGHAQTADTLERHLVERFGP